MDDGCAGESRQNPNKVFNYFQVVKKKPPEDFRSKICVSGSWK